LRREVVRLDAPIVHPEHGRLVLGEVIAHLGRDAGLAGVELGIVGARLVLRLLEIVAPEIVPAGTDQDHVALLDVLDALRLEAALKSSMVIT
jgi:hypothetical protein